MAKKVVVNLVDDLDSSVVATQTIRFGLDGRDYEIDLGEVNAARLRAALTPFTGAARRIGKPRQTMTTAAGGQTGEIRRWARENGLLAGDRGRIPNSIRAAYDRAHQ